MKPVLGWRQRVIPRARSLATSALRWIIDRRWSFVVGFVLSAALSTLSIRAFLFGSGYYEYSDQQWAPNSSVLPTGYFAPTPITSTGNLYPLQFSRDFVTWPIGLFRALGLDALWQEKLFFFYSFSFFVALAYVFSALVTRYTLRQLHFSTSKWREETARVLITAVLFTNVYFLYLNVDGGTVTESLIAVFLGISGLLLLLEPNFRKAIAVTVALTSLGLLLDPADAGTVVVVLAILLIFRSLIHRESFRSFCRHIGQSLLSFIPTALFLVYFFYPTLGHGASIDYPVRSFTISAVQGAAGNTSILNVLRLTGYTWDTLTLAPPTILFYHGLYQSLPGQQSPTTVLLLPGAFSGVWFLSLYAPLAFAVTGLLVRRLRPITLPFVAVLLVCIGLTQWPWFPPTASAITFLAAQPILGPLIGEALYFPYYFMMGESLAIVVLVGSCLTALLAGAIRLPEFRVLKLADRSSANAARSFSTPRPGRYSSPSRAGLSVVTVGVMVILLVLPGWQAFNGSYLPSRSWPTYVGGNGVPDAGPFEPVAVPSEVLAAYNFLCKQPGEFNIYWPTEGANASDTQRAAFFFNAYDAPKPVANLPALPYLVAHDYTGSLLAYLQSQNVRYVVLQNTSSFALANYDYGLASFPALAAFFNITPGLAPVPGLVFPNLTVYEVEDPWGTTYGVSNILSYSGNSSGYATAYAVNAALSGPPAIVLGKPANQSLTIDNFSGTETILSPGELSSYSGAGYVARQSLDVPLAPYNTSPTGPDFNFTMEAGNLSLQFDQQAGTVVTIANWSLTDWGPANVSVVIGNGSISWNAQGSTFVTLNFGPPLTTGQGGIEIDDPSPLSCGTSLRFEYETSQNFAGSLSVNLIDESTNSSVSSGPLLSLLSPNSTGASASFEAPTIPWTKYFTSRFQAKLVTGSIRLTSVDYSVNLESLNSDYHVGYTVQSLGAWTFTNWSSPGPLYYDYENGNFTLTASVPATFSLNYGPPLTTGFGGVPNPEAGAQGVVMTMQLTYRTSPSFSANLFDLAAFYQTSNSSLAPAVGINGPALPVSSAWREANYSVTLPLATRNFTIRLQTFGFVGSVELSNVSFAWAWLRSAPSSPFGLELPIPRNETLRFPSRFQTTCEEEAGTLPEEESHLQGAPNATGLSWYCFTRPDISLEGGIGVAALALFVASPTRTIVGTVYTGPFAVDLVLASGGRHYLPYETLDGDSLFQFRLTGLFSIYHSAAGYIEAYYFLFLVFLAAFYPLTSFLGRLKSKHFGFRR